jgi:hypothetical protein
LPLSNSGYDAYSEQKLFLLEKFSIDKPSFKSVLAVIRKRYAIVGGRIRLLRTSEKSLKRLRTELQSAINQLSIKQMKDLAVVDPTGFVPSICISMCPSHEGGKLTYVANLEENTVYDEFEVRNPSILSRYLTKLKVIKEIQLGKVDYFTLFQNFGHTKSLAGDLFEDMCHEMFTGSKNLGSFNMKELKLNNDDDEAEQRSFTVTVIKNAKCQFGLQIDDDKVCDS